MSRLLELIEIHQRSDIAKPVRTKVPSTFHMEQSIDCVVHELAYDYTVAVTLGYRRVTARPKDIDGFKDQVRREIIELAFGEFREPMLAVERALAEDDIADARAAMRKLWGQMFP